MTLHRLKVFTELGVSFRTTNLIESVMARDDFSATAFGSELAITGWEFDPDPVADDLTPLFLRGRATGSVRSGVAKSLSKSAKLSSTGSWDNCTPNQENCTDFITASGKIVVFGIVDGVALSDTIHVAYVKCKTANNDPIVNQPDIQHAMIQVNRLTNPDLKPGEGLSSSQSHGQRREQGLWIYRNDATGEYMAKYVPDDESMECTTGTNISLAPEIPGYTWVATVHTHIPNGQPVYCNTERLVTLFPVYLPFGYHSHVFLAIQSPEIIITERVSSRTPHVAVTCVLMAAEVLRIGTLQL